MYKYYFSHEYISYYHYYITYLYITKWHYKMCLTRPQAEHTFHVIYTYISVYVLHIATIYFTTWIISRLKMYTLIKPYPTKWYNNCAVVVHHRNSMHAVTSDVLGYIFYLGTRKHFWIMDYELKFSKVFSRKNGWDSHLLLIGK